MNRILLPFYKLSKSRVFWFLVGLASMPLIRYLESQCRAPTAFESMGWVSHYEERKLIFTVLPDFSYTLRFPGDRDKFEKFVKKMNLHHHKVSEDEYKEGINESARSVQFLPENKGFEIEFRSGKT